MVLECQLLRTGELSSPALCIPAPYLHLDCQAKSLLIFWIFGWCPWKQPPRGWRPAIDMGDSARPLHRSSSASYVSPCGSSTRSPSDMPSRSECLRPSEFRAQSRTQSRDCRPHQCEEGFRVSAQVSSGLSRTNIQLQASRGRRLNRALCQPP